MDSVIIFGKVGTVLRLKIEVWLRNLDDPLCNSSLAVVNREFQLQTMKNPTDEIIFSSDEKEIPPNGK